MKCPYRKIIKTEHQYNSDITTEEFCECYGEVCPYYRPKDIFQHKDESCRSIDKELNIRQEGY